MLNLRIRSDASLVGISGFQGPTEKQHSYPRDKRFRRMRLHHQVAFIRQKVWDTFDTPGSSRLAFLVVSYMLLLVMASVVVFVVQTMPRFHNYDARFWLTIEGIMVVQFTIELIARLFCTPDLPGFVRNSFNWIDLIAILPWYIEVIFQLENNDDILRALRTARVLRVLKLSQYSVGWQLFVVALRRSREGLSTLLFLFFIGVVTFAALIFFTEESTMFFDDDQGEWLLNGGYDCYVYDEASALWRTETCYDVAPFQSIPDAFWWAIVTMTTVGYGDETPVSDLGRWVAAACMISGLLVVAFPITIIGTNFNDVWDEFKERRRALADLLAQEAEQRQEDERRDTAEVMGLGLSTIPQPRTPKTEAETGRLSQRDIQDAAHVKATMSMYHDSEHNPSLPVVPSPRVSNAAVDARLRNIEASLADLLSGGGGGGTPARSSMSQRRTVFAPMGTTAATAAVGVDSDLFANMSRDQLQAAMLEIQARLAESAVDTSRPPPRPEDAGAHVASPGVAQAGVELDDLTEVVLDESRAPQHVPGSPPAYERVSGESSDDDGDDDGDGDDD